MSRSNHFIGYKKCNRRLFRSTKKKGARSVIDLNVSAPFHCSLMNEASKIMEEVLEDTDFKNLDTKFISNVTAKIENDINKIKGLLIDQISSRVRWRESILVAEKWFENFP